MKKALLMLLAAAMVGAGVTPTDVEAATKKKKAVATKKQAPRAAAKPQRVKMATRAKSMQRAASLDDSQHLAVQSSAALVLDQTSGAVLFEKNPNTVLPIASITKLMTAMVVLDAKLRLDETLAIGEEDVDIIKGTRSRLKVGTHLAREEMLRLALMSSENRAAAALSRNCPTWAGVRARTRPAYFSG